MGKEKKLANIVGIDQAPPHVTGNVFVLHGYRVNYSWKEAFKSSFSMHNETLNIWTHFLGGISILILMIYALKTWLYDSDLVYKVMFCIWALCSQAQMFSSTFFHLTHCINPTVWARGAALDYSTISLQIVGSHWPLFNYALDCFTEWKIFYLSLITGAGILCTFFSLHPRFKAPQLQPLRAFMFIVMGLTAVVAAPHWLRLIDSQKFMPVIQLVAVMGVLYISGALLYAFKIPERFFPGKLDLTLNSHVLFHLFGIVAAWFMYFACARAHLWHQTTCACCDR
eukprot:TRINITY_DN18066_c0_g1_i1.p1 TRINITY_DN18066_c0_g1~~TRINITY_DN18066_c0_g1_i1.p1  ORF type:complete len:283 (+),score=2.92 TRINITY_DN18066_c0_g1_i1:866-1714(+)